MKISIDITEIQNYSLELQKLLARETKNIFLMEEFAEESEKEVLISLTLNEELPYHILRNLSNINNKILQRNVAKHKNTDRITLSKLAKSKYKSIREAVAQNENSSLETLKLLAQDKCRNVVFCVANNPTTTKDILEMLVTLNDYHISQKAIERLKLM